MKKWMWIAIAIAVVAAGGYFGYKTYQENQLPEA